MKKRNPMVVQGAARDGTVRQTPHYPNAARVADCYGRYEVMPD